MDDIRVETQATQDLRADYSVAGQVARSLANIDIVQQTREAPEVHVVDRRRRHLAHDRFHRKRVALVSLFRKLGAEGIPGTRPVGSGVRLALPGKSEPGGKSNHHK
jgi:hypothetical protein